MKKNQLGKILIICPIGLGNFILASPAIQTLVDQIGVEKIGILALKKGIEQMAQQSGWFSSIHYWDPDSHSIFHGLKVLKKIRAASYQSSVSLFPTGHWKFCLFSLLTGIKKKIGFHYHHTSLPNKIQTDSYPYFSTAHDTEQNLWLIQSILKIQHTFPSRLVFPYLPNTLSPAKMPKKPYYIFHPGSSSQRDMIKKRLPIDKVVYCIKHIGKRFGIGCVLVGGPEEKGLRNEIKAKVSDSILDVHTENLNELGDIIAQAAFFIGNDSGIMHMAVAAQKKCVVFFGPSDEVRTGPYFLNKMDRERCGIPSRGHLILREPPGAENEVEDQNPKLRNSHRTSLEHLDIEESWKKIEPYIDRIMDRGERNQ